MKLALALCVVLGGVAAAAPFIGPPEKTRIVITETHCEMLDPLEFAPGSVALGHGQKKTIAAVARTLIENQEITLLDVTGHADLGERSPDIIALARAVVVMNALITAGVAPERLTAESMSNAEPIDRRPWPSAQAKNRRVAFLILKRGS